MSKIVLSEKEIHNALYFAALEARNSPDPSTTVGAVLMRYEDDGRLIAPQPKIFAQGYNTFPNGVEGLTYETESWYSDQGTISDYREKYGHRLDRPDKYAFIEHAERNAIFYAARRGEYTNGATMACIWGPCADCARAIIQSGIRELITLKHEREHERWNESLSIAMTMLDEAGVEVTYYEGKILSEQDTHINLLRNGQIWRP